MCFTGFTCWSDNWHFCLLSLPVFQLPSYPTVFHNLTISLLSSSEQFALEKPLETALLMSLGGVDCIVVNQWQTSLQQNTQNLAKVLDSRCWTYFKSNTNFPTFDNPTGSISCPVFTPTHYFPVLLCPTEQRVTRGSGSNLPYKMGQPSLKSPNKKNTAS